MTGVTLTWGAGEWTLAAAALLGGGILLAGWSYLRSPGAVGVRVAAACLKLSAVALLALCLIEPLLSGVRPRPGANRFAILVDNSQSMALRTGADSATLGRQFQYRLQPDANWLRRLGRSFDVRRYVFDRSTRTVADFAALDFRGEGSALVAAVSSQARRARHAPTAGVLLLTDGNATDGTLEQIEQEGLPPVYPVVASADASLRDICLSRVAVTLSNFEQAPVSALVEGAAHGFQGATIVLQLLDETGRELERQSLRGFAEGRPFSHRFQFRPEKPGLGFYRIRAFAAAEEAALADPQGGSEATMANNTRWFLVARRSGPYRVLYVGGRPNWDYKFLRRAIAEDEEIELVGLVRIAKREPKFTFRGHQDETTNPLYRGFGNQQDEQAEQYDQPVLIRLDPADEAELRDGFPRAAEELYRYHALVVDDLEAGFFTHDQMSLIQQFVSQRGGGFLMLGGRECFTGGSYEHTPLADLLPVYLGSGDDAGPDETYRLALTREGWLQPWVRLRALENDEQTRLAEMPAFRVLNSARGLKPGATALAHVADSTGALHPALAVQRFGRGQAAALLIGDLWRWNLRRAETNADSDLEKAWRQTLRWLVADVPGRLDVDVRQPAGDSTHAVELTVAVRDAAYRPLDNAALKIEIQTPAGQRVELRADPSDEQAGSYRATFAARESGPHRVRAVAATAEGEPVGDFETGWVAETAAEEFRRLSPDRAALERLAKSTGGEVVPADRLEQFVTTLPHRQVPVTEAWSSPLWHQWPVFLLAVACLVGEWGLRRWKGLP